MVSVAILMTLEGEYYAKRWEDAWAPYYVAILMTLEGEYYTIRASDSNISATSQSSWHWKANITK